MMAHYTTEVRTICEFYANRNNQTPAEYQTTNEIIQNSLPFIFDFDFPIFDESYRNVLETKIIRHYFTQEIGMESVGLWKLKLETKLNEIMPYYNQLYKSELLEFNPLYDVDITRMHNIKNNGTQNTTGDITSDSTTETSQTSEDTSNRNEQQNSTIDNVSKNAYSNTPQGQVTNVDNYTYLTDYRNITENGTNIQTETDTQSTTGKIDSNATNNLKTNTTSDTTISNTEDYIETVKGKQGVGNYSEMLLSFRKTFLNIDMQVIDDLQELFMGIW